MRVGEAISMKVKRIATVHYHLRPGGVTNVITMSLKMLDEVGVHSVVLVGEAPDTDGDLPPDRMAVVPGLGYGVPDDVPAAGRTLRDALEAAAGQALGGPPDVWHIHNHSLGKNPALTWAVRDLARDGHPLLLQIHDFAEDGRPALYRRMYRIFEDHGLDPGDVLYPRGPHVHYATLNRRDRKILKAAGIPDAQSHYLPNPVLPADPLPPPTGTMYLYPVRGIRRKNLGECLLLAALFDGAAQFGVTMAPRNPEQRPMYDFWVDRSRALNLPVAFDIGGGGTSLRTLLQQAKAALSTSITEGFGLGFVEPWLQGRAVVGRNLTEITRDFSRAGVDLEHLYPRLDVPVTAFDGSAFADRLRRAYSETCLAYGRSPRNAVLDTLVAQTIGREYTDFGRLDETAQEQVLTHVVGNGALRDRIASPTSLLTLPAQPVVTANVARIEEAYGSKAFLKRLLRTYRMVRPATAGGTADGQSSRILDQFLTPERFFMLNGVLPESQKRFKRDPSTSSG